MARYPSEGLKMHETTMRRGPRRWIAWVAVGCLVAIVSGCGRNGPERVRISGNITFHGEPVKTGEIRFLPTKGTEGSAEGTLVTDGQYVANGRGGVPVGTYAVRIVAWHDRAPSRDVALPGVLAEKKSSESSRKQLLPAKYKSQSQLEITLAPGSRNIVQDFALTD